jgi:hypothetical protein
MSASPLPRTSPPSTSSSAASPVRISPSPAEAPESQRAPAPGCGSSSPEWFASYARGAWWSRTLGLFSPGGSEPFSGTWPRQGMTRNGVAFARPTSAPPIAANGSSSWPTPDAGAFNVGASPKAFLVRQERLRALGVNGNGMGAPLGMAVQLWPTPTVCGNYNREGASPTSRDGRETVAALWPTPTARDEDRVRDAPGREGSPSLSGAILWPTPLAADNGRGGTTHARGNPALTGAAAWPTPQARDDRGQSGGSQRAGGHDLSTEAGAKGRSLNPAWVEQLMGFPDGWTDGPPSPASPSTRGRHHVPHEASRAAPPGSRPSVTPSARSKRRKGPGV